VQPTPAPPPPPTPTPVPAIPTGSYCPPSPGGSAPPNAIFGLLKINGEDAPVGTPVSLAFDGVIGPTVTTTSAGGYRILWGAGGGDCVNKSGAALAVVVSGRLFDTGQLAGGNIVIRLDIDVQ
jgi:hypothetical protein